MFTSLMISDASKTIKSQMVLSNVNLELYSGNIYGFRGINGSGKSMLFRMMSGLLIPDKGEVKVNDKILHKDISFPESLGLLIENPEFLPFYNGGKNLQILASIKNKIGSAEIDHALEIVGLDKNSALKYRKYSLGMKQRLAIAQAIMESPDILILDEPTNALDEKAIKDLENYLKSYKTKDKLILVSSHDKLFLERISDEIYRVESGKVFKEETLSRRENTK
ncbi:ABC-2 type transport system ATP-binding protein [Scopulibacillus daqui]|uniref:ABC-2 type transport system ATP-binding protein n=1 Tax=Scopulibacillus daqui TaxID=1469162 RepID=A0ABS2Q0K2_9BACL|nr:ATP-binding cassette domain-containing protein [Scopulibacillus daqui]MBM7645490.1 ABC-2 type transport system ATP-binding protein [Scopulibacillus daqui]